MKPEDKKYAAGVGNTVVNIGTSAHRHIGTLLAADDTWKSYNAL